MKVHVSSIIILILRYACAVVNEGKNGDDRTSSRREAPSPQYLPPLEAPYTTQSPSASNYPSTTPVFPLSVPRKDYNTPGLQPPFESYEERNFINNKELTDSHGSSTQEFYGPPKPQYGLPSYPFYETPPKQEYGPPPRPEYGPPSLKPQYGLQSEYGPPPIPVYGLPQRPDYGPPTKPSYGPPPKPVYGPPAIPTYSPPPKPVYGPPSVPTFSPSSGPSFSSSSGSSYGPPPKPVYGPPAGPSYSFQHGPSQVATAPTQEPFLSAPPKPVYESPASSFNTANYPSYNAPVSPGYLIPKPVYGSPTSNNYGPTQEIVPSRVIYSSDSYNNAYTQDVHLHPAPGVPSPPTPPVLSYDGWRPMQLDDAILSHGYQPYIHSQSRNPYSGDSERNCVDSKIESAYSSPSISNQYDGPPPPPSYQKPFKPTQYHPFGASNYQQSGIGAFRTFHGGSAFSQQSSTRYPVYPNLKHSPCSISDAQIDCHNSPPSDLSFYQDSYNTVRQPQQPGLAYGIPSGKQIEGPRLQPKIPVKFRPPVPAGLLESIGKAAQYGLQGNKPPFRGETYIPPAIPEISKTPDETYSSQNYRSNLEANHSPKSSNEISNYQENEQRVHSPSPIPTGPEILHSENHEQLDTSDAMSYSVSAPADPQSTQLISRELSPPYEAEKELPLSKTYPADLEQESPQSYGTPVQSFSISNGDNIVASPGPLDLQPPFPPIESSSSDITGQPISISQGVGLISGSSFPHEFPIRGNKGQYILQIQSANENQGESIPHNQLLSNGLLKDIISSIEQDQQSIYSPVQDGSNSNRPYRSGDTSNELVQVESPKPTGTNENCNNNNNNINKENIALYYSGDHGISKRTSNETAAEVNIPNKVHLRKSINKHNNNIMSNLMTTPTSKHAVSASPTVVNNGNNNNKQ